MAPLPISRSGFLYYRPEGNGGLPHFSIPALNRVGPFPYEDSKMWRFQNVAHGSQHSRSGARSRTSYLVYSQLTQSCADPDHACGQG
jgi:hypothetical protein